MSSTDPVRELKFWSKVDKQPGGCWLWTASKGVNGYGQFNAGGRIVRAHRYAYELIVGRVPDGLSLDHLCRNRACVNPDHLEPVSHRTNVLRGSAPMIQIHRSGTCGRGHPRTDENMYWRKDRPGTCVCRACRRELRAIARQQRGPRPNPQRVKTHCPQGHEYAGDNLYIRADGNRGCKECRREATRKYRRDERGRLAA